MTAAASTSEPTVSRLRRPSLPRLVVGELRKSADTRSGQVLVGLLALLAVGAGVDLAVTHAVGDPVVAVRFVGADWSAVRLLLPVVGVLSMTSEWSRRTAASTFTLVPRRGRVLAAKLVAALLLAVTAVLLTAVVSSTSAAAAGSLTGQPVEWGGTAARLGGALVGSVCFMGLGIAVGVALQHTAAALVTYFVAPTLVTLAGSALVGDRVAWVAVTPAIVRLETLRLDAAAASSATALAVWILLPLVVGVIRWLRREVP